MKRGNVTPLYPSQQRQAAALKARIGPARILLLDAMCSCAGSSSSGTRGTRPRGNVRADDALAVAYRAWLRAGRPGPQPEQLHLPNIPREWDRAERLDRSRGRRRNADRNGSLLRQ